MNQRRAWLTREESRSPRFYFSRRCRCQDAVSMAGVVIWCPSCDLRGRRRRFWAVYVTACAILTALIGVLT